MKSYVLNPFKCLELSSKRNSISKNTIKVNKRSIRLIYNFKKEKFNIKTNFFNIPI